MNPGLDAAVDLAKKLPDARILILPSLDGKKIDPNSYFGSGKTSDDFNKEVIAEAKDIIEVMVGRIDKEIPKTQLRKTLESVFEQLVVLDEIDATAYIRYTIGPHFDLKTAEVNTYISYLKKLQKIKEETDQQKTGAEESQKEIKVSLVETDEFIAEEIYNLDEDPPFLFAVFNKLTEELTYKPEIELDGKLYLPDDSEVITKRIVQLPSKAVFVSDEELDNEIDQFTGAYLWMKGKNRFLSGLYIRYTWIFDRYSVAPYLRTSGSPGSGKTRSNDAVGVLCYKPLITSGGLSEAVLFRVVDEFAPTLVINEFDKLNSDEKSLFTIILNNGFEKNKPIARMVPDAKGNWVYKFFKVFSPKVFATIDRFKDTALESRIVSLDSAEFPKETRNDYPVMLSDGFYEWAAEIRNMMLGYRFKYIAKLERARKLVLDNLKSNPDSQTLRQMRTSESGLLERSELEKKFLALNDLEARTRQTFFPFLFTLKDKDFDQFIVYVREYQKDIIRKRSEGLDGLIATKIIQIYERKQEVSVPELKLEVNNELTIREEVSSQKIGSLLNGRLKIETEVKGHKNITYLLLDEITINSLKKKYKLSSGEESHADSQQPQDERTPQQNEANSSSPTNSQKTSNEDILKPCYMCGGTKFWKRQDGQFICATCHPPLDQNLTEYLTVTELDKTKEELG